MAVGEDLSRYIDEGVKSTCGRGGMATKHRVARRLASEGVEVVIANGLRPDILTSLVLGPPEGAAMPPSTVFEPAPEAARGVKKWIAHSDSFAKGALRVNSGAADALRTSPGSSLLPVGVTDVEGDFERDDIVRVLSPEGDTIAWGRVSFPSEYCREAMGRPGMKALIHADYLYVDELADFRDS